MFDELIFEKLVELHGSALYRYCLVGTSFDVHLADEVYNDSLVILFEKWDSLDKKKGIRTWLYRTADHLILRARRKKAKQLKKLSSFEDLTEAELGGKTDEYFALSTIPENSVDRIMEALPQELREAFKLRFLEKLSIREVAERVGLSYTALRMRLIKAEKLARQEISNIFNQ